MALEEVVDVAAAAVALAGIGVGMVRRVRLVTGALVVLSAHFHMSGVLRRMLARLKMKATSSTEMAAISTHMIDWYGCVGSVS